MAKIMLLGASLVALLALLAGLTLQASAQFGGAGPTQVGNADGTGSARWGDYETVSQVIPPADVWEVQYGPKSARARAEQERARVQGVIDYFKANHRFPPRTRPFDSAQQVVMDYIRIHNRVPASAGQVADPRQAVLDYIRIHRAMPPHPAPVDPAIQDVMDYIRRYNFVPLSAGSVQ